MLYLSVGIAVYCGVLAFVLGACMGSFLNCMSWRIVHQESVLRGRSHCDACGHVLSAPDLFPIFSYLVNRGRCRWCGARLSARHLWAEVLTGVSYVLLLFKYDISLQALEALLLASILLASAFADLEGYIIPDRFIVAGIATQKRRRAQENAKLFPWGPSICAAAIAAMLCGDWLIEAYLRLF